MRNPKIKKNNIKINPLGPRIIKIAPIKQMLKKISLKEAEKNRYKELGEAFGINLEHCIQEGLMHCKDFEKRAKYYAIKLDMMSDLEEIKFITNAPKMMIVSFYENEIEADVKKGKIKINQK